MHLNNNVSGAPGEHQKHWIFVVTVSDFSRGNFQLLYIAALPPFLQIIAKYFELKRSSYFHNMFTKKRIAIQKSEKEVHSCET